MSLKCHHCDDKALIHITEIDEAGAAQEVHLCWTHAQAYLRDADEEKNGEAIVGGHLPAIPPSTTGPCPICKLTFAEFRATGRLGCPHDYDTFAKELRPLMENIHGSLRHIGKAPKHLPTDTQAQSNLIRLRQELQHAVAIENYERAAELRDQIDTQEKRD